MKAQVCITLAIIGMFVFSTEAVAQGGADEICREFGETPTREFDRTNRLAPYVFGRVVLKGLAPNAKLPRITVVFSDSRQPAIRQIIGRSGNYCFRRQGSGGMLIVDIDGVEATRKTVTDIGDTRQREDFEIIVPNADKDAPPGVVSTRFARPPNARTTDLYKRAAEAEANKDIDKARLFVRQIVAIDPEDFIAWAKLGSLLVASNDPAEAESAFRRSLKIRGDYTPALINLGMLAAMQKYYPAAIAIFQEAIKSDPRSALAHRLLGEAHLQDKQGSLGLAALDKALELDPQGQAECHLLKARLYDLAGARDLATREYRAFLAKVPDYTDKKTLEKYIKDNP